MPNKNYLGCSGFYYNHWRGSFYPQKIAKTKWLQYYTQFFNTLEANNTFYRFPSQRLLESWYKNTPDNFKFTLKANRAITHMRKFQQTEQYIKNFYELAQLLREKLLCVLFQLPPYVHKSMDLLEKIVSQLDLEVTNVLEFRHKSWWEREVYDFMDTHGLVFCSVSASELPQTVVKTSPAVYVRFHGKNGWYKHFYTEAELQVWAQKIRAQNPKQIICYFNNDFNANAPKNCLTLKKVLELQVGKMEESAIHVT